MFHRKENGTEYEIQFSLTYSRIRKILFKALFKYMNI
jgi:hypothetical protein